MPLLTVVVKLFGVLLTVGARWPDLSLLPSLALVAAYPLVLALFGFYLPIERKRMDVRPHLGQFIPPENVL